MLARAIVSDFVLIVNRLPVLFRVTLGELKG
jgi:hypothetical protein